MKQTEVLIFFVLTSVVAKPTIFASLTYVNRKNVVITPEILIRDSSTTQLLTLAVSIINIFCV